MEEPEAAFIIRRYKEESKIYIRTMNVFLALAAFSPLVVCIVFLGLRNDMTWNKMLLIYSAGLAFMLVFVGLIAWFSYNKKVKALYQDHKALIRIVEKTTITQKRAMGLNNTYHFYLDSPTLYTIEVSPEDYMRFELGDEVNIEYAKYSREFFGYF